MTDLEIRAMLSERDTLLLTILGEARGEELEGRVSVGNVIRTRARDPKRWPDDLKGVCLERLQFSCWNSTDANYRRLMEAAKLLVEDHAVRTTFVSDALWQETRWLADGLLAGVVRDRVGRANHYITRALWESRPPLWAKDQRPVALVGHHVFFAL